MLLGDHAGMDLLEDALRVTGARGALGTRIEAGGAWGLWLDRFPGAALHAVLDGQAWLDVPSQHPIRLRTGDIVLLPPGTAHGLSDEPGVQMGPCDARAAAQARSSGGVVRLGSGRVSARLLTLHYRQDPEVSTLVLSTLGAPLHVAADDNASLAATIGLLRGELADPRIGTTAAVNSLIDLLLVQFVRAWLAAHPGQRSGSWLGAMLDPVVRDALTCLHREPGRPWTTADLADAVRVSRATLSRRFAAALGQSPSGYLTRWRMDLATLRLRDTDEPVEAVAAAVGYTSAHAFSRAFRRVRGAAPSQYRLTAREPRPD